MIKEFFDEPKTVGSFMLILLSPEFLRLFLFMELINGFMFVFVTLIHWPSTIMAIISNVFVVIFNYILSKLFVFRKSKETK